MKGWFYIIKNDSFPKMFMAGYSQTDPFKKATDMACTGSPLPYKVEFEILVDDCVLLYKTFIKEMTKYRVDNKANTEENSCWFNQPPRYLVGIVYELSRRINPKNAHYYGRPYKPNFERYSYEKNIHHSVIELENLIEQQIEKIQKDSPNYELLQIVLDENKRNRRLSVETEFLARYEVKQS